VLPRQICAGPFSNLTENFLICLYFLNRPDDLLRMRGTASGQANSAIEAEGAVGFVLHAVPPQTRFNNATPEHLVVQEQNIGRIYHEPRKVLTFSRPERHDHGALSLPAADKPPPDILPAGRKVRRVHSQKNYQ